MGTMPREPTGQETDTASSQIMLSRLGSSGAFAHFGYSGVTSMLRFQREVRLSLGHVSVWLPAFLLMVSAEAMAQAVPKIGTCPSGYHASGGACVPLSGAGPALPKVGSCPSGYYTSGDYCLGFRNARHAIPKTGSCPSGYYTSGAYCRAFR